MFYETAQTIGPGWHGKSFKPSHYDDMSWNHPTSSARHFRSPGSSPTFRRRIINYDDDDDDSEPNMFQRRNPAFEREFFKEAWNDHPRRKDAFEDRPGLFKRTVKRDWDKDVEDFENSLRRDRDFRDEFKEPRDDDDYDGLESNSGRVRHIPILVESRREKMDNTKPYRSRRSSPPPPPSSLEQEEYVDESDEWLRNHMDRLKQNFDSSFSTLQNRHNRHHRLPRVDPNCRPRAFTSPIPDWGPESVHTLPTRKLHSRVVLDEKRNPKSVFRSYSETHEDIPREHPTASRSQSDSHCPKTTYVTKVSVNVPSEKSEEAGTTTGCEEGGTTTGCEEGADRPVPPQRRSRYRSRKAEDITPPEQEAEQVQEKKNLSEASTSPESKPKEDQGSQAETAVDGESKTRKNSVKDGRGASALLQISSVLQNVEDLVHHVEAYRGNGRDKQFRFLDEMLTRCMLRLDDVDTDGLDDVRTARKAAVRQVQACIEKLESRATEDRGKSNDHSIDNDNTNEETATEDKPVESSADEEAKIPDEGPETSSTNDAPSSEEGEQTRL